MYTDATPASNNWGAAGGGSAIRGSGYGISDTAGVLAPGTTGPSFRGVSGNGGIYGNIDASRFFGFSGNQSLILAGYFDYRQASIDLGAVPAVGPLVRGNSGSLHADTYTFGGEALYRAGTAYLRSTAKINFGHTNVSNNIASSTGSFDTSGYGFDERFGNVFVLTNTTGAPGPTTLPTKAPPKSIGGVVIGLDLSGHIGYTNNQSNGYTDSSGFTFGTGVTRTGVVGGRAELFELALSNDLLWKPYVAGTIDQLFGFSSAQDIPSQAAFAGGDTINLHTAKTFGGAELGVTAMGRAGWTVGIKGFYQASSDTKVEGGSAYFKIPFNYMVAARY
jgi:hypothetical protein